MRADRQIYLPVHSTPQQGLIEADAADDTIAWTIVLKPAGVMSTGRPMYLLSFIAKLSTVGPDQYYGGVPQ